MKRNHYTPYEKIGPTGPIREGSPQKRSPRLEDATEYPESPVIGSKGRAKRAKPVEHHGRPQQGPSEDGQEERYPVVTPPRGGDQNEAQLVTPQGEPPRERETTLSPTNASTGATNRTSQAATPNTPGSTRPQTSPVLRKTAKARPPREKPPWAHDQGQAPVPFAHLKPINTHPFQYKENLVYLRAADNCPSTEVHEALLERNYLDREEIQAAHYAQGQVQLSKCKDIYIVGICIKTTTNEKPTLTEIRRCLSTLKEVLRKHKINSVAVIHDPEMLTPTGWVRFVNEFNTAFEGEAITAVEYKNNHPVPPTAERYTLIKEYHTSAAGGHRGVHKTLHKVATDYYWRNMRADVKQFVARCRTCSNNKLVRIKTRLPMVITNTPAVPFDQIALDFYGPLPVTDNAHRYILTVQDALSKYVILIPTRHASAEEVARALIERVICVFGTPGAILTDQGTHFQNKTLQELAKRFRIKKFTTTAYHAQSNGAIERMHHTLTEYLRKYAKNPTNWDEWLALCQHAYNCTVHESTRYTPHEIVFGITARTPSSFGIKKPTTTYNEYIQEVTANLERIQTLAAMNAVQAKYRSKYYYDRKLNTKHFRVGEMVLLLNEPARGKFTQEYIGPFEILDINWETHNATLKIGEGSRVTHIDKIKRASAMAETPESSENEMRD